MNEEFLLNNLAKRLLILKSLIIIGDFLRIKLTSVYVDDQEKALKFYTEMLGFIKKADISAGGYRWLTVVSPEDQMVLSWFLSQTKIQLQKHTRKLFSSRVFVQQHSL